MADPAARLACYDTIPIVPAASPAQPRSAPQPAPPPPGATFGLESRSAPAAGTNVASSIESSVDGPFDGWLAKTQFRLVNGQIWEIADGSSAAYRLSSPKVTITRGVAGSFFMQIEGVVQTPRVRRLR